MDAIRQMLAPHASVLRSGGRHSIEGEKLVIGVALFAIIETEKQIRPRLNTIKS